MRFLNENEVFQNSPQSCQSFARNFVVKNFKKVTQSGHTAGSLLQVGKTKVYKQKGYRRERERECVLEGLDDLSFFV